MCKFETLCLLCTCLKSQVGTLEVAALGAQFFVVLFFHFQ